MKVIISITNSRDKCGYYVGVYNIYTIRNVNYGWLLLAWSTVVNRGTTVNNSECDFLGEPYFPLK